VTPKPFAFEIGEQVMGLASSLGLDIVVVGKVETREHRFDREIPSTFMGNIYKIVLDKDILPMESYPRSIATVEGTYYLDEGRLRKFNKYRFKRVLDEWFMFNSAIRARNQAQALLFSKMYGGQKK
jgi:hypothetical protein